MKTLALILTTIIILINLTACDDTEFLNEAKDKIDTWIESQTSNETAKETVVTPELPTKYRVNYPASNTKEYSDGLVITSPEPFGPPIDVWRYKVETGTRIFYANSVKKSDQGVTMTGYWDRMNDEWVYRNKSLLLPSSVYKNIMVSNAPDIEIR